MRADRAHPNPGRTISPCLGTTRTHADLCLDMTMPGTTRGEGHDGRCGPVFWQDTDNDLVANLFVDDAFDGASVSTFYHLGGKEPCTTPVDVGARRRFRAPLPLRVAFDGQRFQADVNGHTGPHPRAHGRLSGGATARIARVGIVVNRESGDDTGSMLHGFTRGGRRPAR